MTSSDNKNNDDKDLFKQAMSDVTPIKQTRVSLKPKPSVVKKRAQPAHHETIADTLSDEFVPEAGDFLEFMRPGTQKSLLKQLRNGKLPVEGHIDLHGYTRDNARKTLLGFIQHAQQQGYKIVCVVHGKGYHSEDGRPVLKALVNKWLQNIPEVLAFATAQPRDGGTGAVYALLKKQYDRK
ncbi:MAG: Smr/MutS family endonuclease [Gammaproteobacteria bacterium]|nr:Smr/MutS family endonuclease [Gammaproteobacteria bacterium]